MGKQVRFFTLDNDQEKFLRFIYEDLSSYIVDLPSTSPKLLIIRKLSEAIEYCSHQRVVYISKPQFPLSKKYISKYTVEKSGEIRYSFEYITAPVIEFRRSFLSQQKFVQGRVWASMYIYDEEGNTVSKADGFKNWYEQIARWIRRNGKRVQGIDGYIFEGALEWHQRGGVL
jgi:hypothetical protein